MAKPEKAKQARVLRAQGKSIADIASALSVSKSSVSGWCAEMKLSQSQKNYLRNKQIDAGHAGRVKGAQRNKDIRLQTIEQYRQTARGVVKTMSQRELLLFGVALYWGEGAKSKSDPASIINSDPDVLVLSKQWFRVCFSVPDSEFRPYVYISAQHKDRSETILKYWSKLLHIPKNQFKIITLNNRPQKKYDNHDTYFGVVALRVRRSANLKYQILGLIDACKKG